MQSENIEQQNVVIQTKPNPLDIASPNTKQIQALEDKTNISQKSSSLNTSGIIDQSILGKRLCSERGSGSSQAGVSGDRSPFSEVNQNISASYGNSANTSYEEDQAEGAQAKA